MTASWLVGVFVFAILIGDIRDIVLNARKSELRFQKQLDNVSAYMNRNRVVSEVQDRVKMWMNYTWSQQKSFGETEARCKHENLTKSNLDTEPEIMV